MTEDSLPLFELIDPSADNDLVRNMLACAAGRLMEMEVEAHGRGSRCPLRGSQDLQEWLPGESLGHTGWPDRAGYPEAGQGRLLPVQSFDRSPGSIKAFGTGPSLLEPRRTAVIQEAYIRGISTRAVDDPVKAMGGTGMSKSQVSRLCEGKAG